MYTPDATGVAGTASLPEHPCSHPVFSGVPVIHSFQLHACMFLIPCHDVRREYHVIIMIGVSTPIGLEIKSGWIRVLSVLFVFI